MSYIGNSPGVASQRVETAFTATSSQTVFTPSSGYTLGYCDVYYNGVKLVNGDDYTAADGVSITLATAAAAGDSVVVVASFPRGLTDGYLKAEADAKYVALTGDQTIAGVKTFSGSATIVNGNLGVGTSSVLGNSTLNAALGIVVRNQSTTTGYFQTYNANAGSNLKTWRWGGTDAGNLVFETVNDAYSSATNRLTLDASGNLGVGTTSPVTKVHARTGASSALSDSRYVVRAEGTSEAYLSAAANDYVGVRFPSASSVSQAYIDYYHGINAMLFGVNNTERMRIDSSGNFLVGTTSSTYGASGRGVIEVNGGSTAIAALKVNNSGAGYIYHDGTNMSVLNVLNGPLQFGTNGTERARIDTSGNLLVGATSSSRKFVVEGSNSVTSYIHNTRNVSGDYTMIMALGGSNTNNTSSHYLLCDTDNVGIRMVVYGNGNIQNVNNSYGAYSDIKLKENITDATPKLADLMQVQIRNYNLIGEETKQIGVVAQELEQIFPGMIEESPDYENVTTTDEDGNEQTERVLTGTTTKSVKYSVFVPMLIKAIQEQQAIIEQLEADVQTLKEAA